MNRLPPMLCKPHRVPECPQCKEMAMTGKCEHGLTTKECLVCASPKYAESSASQYERNAKRYQWLREQDWFSGPLAVVRNPKEAIKLGYDAPSRDRLDAFIDAAMQEQTKPAATWPLPIPAMNQPKHED